MQKTAIIFGGTGFIGRILVKALAKQNYRIVLPTRHVRSAYASKLCGKTGQITPVSCNFSEESIQNVVTENADLVVNLIGILYEKRKGDFKRVHHDIAKNIAKACATKKAKKLIHISALGIDQSTSKYAKTKLAGENAAKEAYPKLTILRPSVIFGADDGVFNRPAQLSILLPFLPLIGGGKTKFQPVYVGNVVDAILACANQSSTDGKIYELGGEDIITFRGLYEKMFTYTKRPRKLFSLPSCFAKMGAFFFEFFPNPVLTRDQVTSLKYDSIVSEEALGLKELGICPTSMDLILPQYLSRFQPGGDFGEQKNA